MTYRTAARLPARAGFVLCGFLLHSSVALAEPSYDQLIEQARNGLYQPVLDFLSEASALTAQRQLDHLLISGWAGLDSQVVQLYERTMDQLPASADGHATAARAYRNLQRWPQGLQAVRQARSLAPHRQDLQIIEVMILADAGQNHEAIHRARQLVQEVPNDADRRLALGYALLRDGQQYAALNEFDRARDIAPEQRHVLREYLFALQRSGMQAVALDLVRAQPGLLSSAELRHLEVDVVAGLVRLADMPTRLESERFVIADRAIAQADRLLREWEGNEEAIDDRTRLRIDRLGALHARVHMQALADEYRRLESEQVALPAYAQRWVASALLYLRQPEEAAQLYRQVIATETDKDSYWLADHQGLFYALVESEMLDEAHALSVRLAEQQPKRLYPKGTPGGIANDAWLDAQTLLAGSFLNRDDTPAAEQAFTELSDAAPNNVGLRTRRAGIYQARGWPRRAEAQLKIAESAAPRSLDVEVGQGMGALALQEWRQLDLLADDVIHRYPESLSAQRLDRLRQVHHMAELRVSGYRGRSSDNEAIGNGDFGIDTLVYSAPLHDDWRLFGGIGYGQGDFVEGRGHHRSVRAGVERRVRNHTLEAEVSSHAYGHGERQGARLSSSHDLNDHWQYGLSFEVLSRDTPLRALNSDVDADGFATYVQWRASERREWRLSASLADFSDGNDRTAVSLAGRERLYTAALVQVDLGLDLATSRNSQGGKGPYFNPDADFSALPSLNATHILHRHYQLVWSQNAQLGMGGYSQRGYGSDAIAVLGYGQRLRFDDRFDGGMALSALSRPYDGERELEYRLVFDVTYRF